jgi:maleylpyruvate isomerase
VTDAALFGYWRSSAAYRARIGCHLKGLLVAQALVHLRKGEQHSAARLARNFPGLAPVWREDGFLLSQSLAILEYLDETHPEPPLLSGEARQRAVIRELAFSISAGIHPIGKPPRVEALMSEFGADDAARGLEPALDWAD